MIDMKALWYGVPMSERTISLLAVFVFTVFIFAGCNTVGGHKQLTAQQKKAITDIQNGENVGQAKAWLLASDISTEFLFERLAHHRTYDPGPELVWDFNTIRFENGYSLDYGFRIPNNYVPTHSYPVLIALHGAVSRSLQKVSVRDMPRCSRNAERNFSFWSRRERPSPRGGVKKG